MSQSHEFSVEVLVHFRCARCRRYWTLSGLDNTTDRSWTCPRCEHIAEAIPMAPMESDQAEVVQR